MELTYHDIIKPVKTKKLCICGNNLTFFYENQNYPGSGSLRCLKCGNTSSFCENFIEAINDFNWRFKK